ncbi:hypothetical protein AB0N73_01650 [Microbacterium sp. NPDC089189]|uniref:hypothetical protein n=1 Tax=Microbacterium sp. NPDC089189 TaxID=3154972 RepID=UPI0034270B2D
MPAPRLLVTAAVASAGALVLSTTAALTYSAAETQSSLARFIDASQSLPAVALDAPDELDAAIGVEPPQATSTPTPPASFERRVVPLAPAPVRGGDAPGNAPAPAPAPEPVSPNEPPVATPTPTPAPSEGTPTPEPTPTPDPGATPGEPEEESQPGTGEGVQEEAPPAPEFFAPPFDDALPSWLLPSKNEG